MAKPAITKRTVKGAALTYNELDTNFQNLADATVSLTAGTGGTQVTVDLNGNITLVAGTNVTITGNNTAKTITINATGGGGGGVTNPMTANLDLGSYNIFDSTGSVKLTDNVDIDGALTMRKSGLTPTLEANVITSLTLLTATGTNDLVIRTLTTGVGVRSRITLSDDGTSVDIGNSSSTGFVGFNPGITLHNGISTATRDTITAVNGMMIYNASTHKFQGYANGTWVDLH